MSIRKYGFVLLLALPLAGQEPEVADPACAQSESRSEDGGPAVLSRGGPGSMSREGRLLTLQPFVSVQGLYETGLTAVALDENGQLGDAADYGVSANFGVMGYHSWKHTLLGLDYRGNARHYAKQSSYDGIDNSLALSLEHQASRRWTVILGQSVDSLSRDSVGGWAGVTDYAPAGLDDLAGNELFNGRTTSLTTTGRAVYQRNLRTSLAFGGSGFMVRRSSALISSQGYTASVDVSRRVSRYRTIGVDYSFTHFGFSHAFGSTDAHGIAFNFSERLGRFWEFRLRAGAFRVETLMLARGSVDPIIAAIIGRSYRTEGRHRVTYAPNGEASLERRMKRASLLLNYARTITPGNGMTLASASENGSLAYNWTPTRNLHFGLIVNATRYRSLMETIGYTGYGAGASASYRLGKQLSLTMNMNGRRYEVPGSGFHRLTTQAAVGLAYNPGDLPLPW